MVAATCVLAALGALAVVGAFKPTDEARAMFTSWPLVALWLALCGLLAAGFVVFGVFRRRVGVAAMHAGCVLVIGGTMWGSQTGHEFQRRLGADKTPRGYAMIGPEGAGLETPLYDREMMTPLGKLPLGIRLEGFRIDLYPPEAGPWLLLLDMFFPSEDLDPRATHQMQLDRATRDTVLLPMTDITLRIISSTPAVYDGRELTQRPTVLCELTRGQRMQTVKIEPRQGATRVGLPLIFLYDDQRDWFRRGSPAIVLTRPGLDLPRNYYADVSVHRDGVQVAAGTISVNRPLHYGGYHFYFDGASAEGDYVMLVAASDSGWLAVWVGFLCMTGGVVWLFWLAPLWRAARRRIARRRTG